MEKEEIIYGRNPVLEYLRQINDTSGVQLLVSKSAHGKIIDKIKSISREKNVKIELVEKKGLSSYQSSSKHQGVVLVTPKIISRGNDTNDLLLRVHEKKGVIVLLDQLTDPHNIGSIIRTTEALGGDGVVIPKANAPKIDGVIHKSSAGATAHLKTVIVPNVANFIDSAKKKGLYIIGSGVDGNTDLARIKELKPAVIIIGSEGKGMRRLTREKCDYIFSIPLAGNISSLNASVAAGILLYEAIT